jgi:hypothetical protein
MCRVVKTLLWALLLAAAWFAWFVASTLLLGSLTSGPILDDRELRYFFPHLVAGVVAGLIPGLALWLRLRSLGGTPPKLPIIWLALFAAPLGPAIHQLLPRMNWFAVAMGIALYLGAAHDLLLRRYTRGPAEALPGVALGTFIAILISAGDIWGTRRLRAR